MPQITLMTYTRVACDATPGTMTARPHDAGVDRFLQDHVHALRRLAERGDAPLADFLEIDAQRLFQKLRAGTDEEFYAASRALAQRLIARMDGRAAPGLLVCLRITDGQELSGATLKLEVVTPNAAVLEALESGEEVLAAATNVLDAPGDLQKGALVPDRREGSDVVVGDRLARDAAYFPAAFGIQTTQRAADTAAELIDSIQRHAPESAAPAVRALPWLEPGPVAEVLEQLASQVPGLDEQVRADVESDLLSRQRPVRDVHTSGSVKTVIQGNGVTVSGSAAAMTDVVVEPDPAGEGWRIVIPLAERPRTIYRR